MSRESLIQAFKRGAISRREFIRGMVSLGATVTAASYLADTALAAPDPAAVVMDDVYGNDEAVLGSGANGGSDDVDPDALLSESQGPNGRNGRNSAGRGDDEQSNIYRLPNVGVGQSESRSRSARLFGLGSVLAAATAIGIRKTKQADESLESWQGWSGDDADAKRRSSSKGDAAALPSGDE